jgi:hypothetical protein
MRVKMLFYYKKDDTDTCVSMQELNFFFCVECRAIRSDTDLNLSTVPLRR